MEPSIFDGTGVLARGILLELGQYLNGKHSRFDIHVRQYRQPGKTTVLELDQHLKGKHGRSSMHI
jgi:hypothetical protein